jgi:hypothetical protein
MLQQGLFVPVSLGWRRGSCKSTAEFKLPQHIQGHSYPVLAILAAWRHIEEIQAEDHASRRSNSLVGVQQ